MKGLLHALNPPRQNLSGPFRNLRVALIADELTRSCLAHECQIREVTPRNYRLILKPWRPDLLFVESAWKGLHETWKYKIASYPDRPERNNSALAKVVRYARDLGIPCVFWNKEDGAHFERFISSASLFDYIFTVDANCIERYRERIGRDVVVKPLMFAVQPLIHFPGAGYRHRRACFVGSYSHHIHDRRRQWQNVLFSASSEIGLTIFDRNSDRKSTNYRYPEMPWIELRKSVPHEKTAQIYRDHMVSLNVNTVEDSPTMFSRRLIEIIACGGLAVTTPAKSVDLHFREFCQVVETEEQTRELLRGLKEGLRPQDMEMARAGAEHIARNFTWAHRLETILDAIK